MVKNLFLPPYDILSREYIISVGMLRSSGMNVIKKSIGAMIVMAIAQSAAAAPFGVEARSLGMGNVSVVTSDIATAAFANPGMLAFQKQRDDFSLLLPSIGLYLDDSDGVVDLIDTYQAAEAAGNTADQQAALNQLLGKVVSPQVSVATAVGFSGYEYSLAVSARSDIIAAGTVTGVLPDPTLIIFGVQTTEVGISLARNFRVGGHKVSAGFTPKIVNVKSVVVNESLSTLDNSASGFLDNSTETDHGEFTTVDAGIVFELSEDIQLGLVAKNLLPDEANTLAGKLKFDTELRAGIAYRGGFFTLGADMDISENDPAISSSPGDKERMLLLGAEFNAFDVAQIRLGMQKNIASGISSQAKKELLTAGVGFWFGFHLDVAVIAGDDVLGGFVQTGFRF